MNTKPAPHIFYIIIASQFCCTSLWFAVNAILPQLQQSYQWPTEAIGYITSSVQLGFISGTLLFALTGISDRYSPSLVFFASSILAALANLVCLIALSSLELTLISRLLTGFFLAGIYPVGMKIASDWQKDGLGHWLGALVGALVLGTAFPHGLKLVPAFVDAPTVIIAVSILCVFGGLNMWLFVEDGPYRKPALRFSFSEVKQVFKNVEYNSAAFGYFGHMWELYAFWAFIPIVLQFYSDVHNIEFSIPFWSFTIIAAGFAGCVIGGKLSLTFGSKRIAALALGSSAFCCLFSPILINLMFPIFVSVMILWGFMVVADSPQFSTLIAKHARPEIRGSAITIATCIGFAITIISIQLLTTLQHQISGKYILLLLTPGPVLGMIWLLRMKNFAWKK